MFSSGITLSDLIELCRVLRHYLHSGLTLPMVFRQQANRGSAAVRPLADRVAKALESGDSLEAALKDETKLLPPLFISLASVGERSGMLPEVFGDLEKYYLRQQKLKREFLGRIAWPVLQFIFSTFILAGMVFVLGLLTPAVTPQGKPYDPLGLGLHGTSGALTLFACLWSPIVIAWLLWIFLGRSLQGKAFMDRFLLRLYAIGPTLEALALNRFCMALRVTTETGMSIHKALRLSFRATGNEAFVAVSSIAEASVKNGEELHLALSKTRMLPEELLRILEVAEEAGTLAEVLRHQAEHYHEEASIRLGVLSSVASYFIGGAVGLFIIIAIFRLYSSYLNMLNLF
jgi:type II secretory pathway component PulF